MNESNERIREMVTSSTNSKYSATAQFAVQMIIENSISIEIDSFINLIVDGISFDGPTMCSLRK
jgi:hypothetical protein